MSLTSAFPKDTTKIDDKGDPFEPGRDLFDAFRPCYIRAFNDAKDIVDDKGGKVLEGTKDSTADDFVSRRERRREGAGLRTIVGTVSRFVAVEVLLAVHFNSSFTLTFH